MMTLALGLMDTVEARRGHTPTVLEQMVQNYYSTTENEPINILPRIEGSAISSPGMHQLIGVE